MRKIRVLFLGILMYAMFVLNVNAASFGMTSSTKTVAPNSTFTIKVGGDCIGRVNLSVSNGTLSSTSVWVEQGYQSVAVTAGSSGTVTVTASPVTGFSDSDANIYNPGSRSVSVSIKSSDSSAGSSTSKPSKPSTDDKRSSENSLSSITIDPEVSSFKFDKNKTEYSVNLGSDIRKVNIKATPVDSKARVTGTGEISLKPGTNIVSIVVTAENGVKKTYIIKLYVDETPEVYIDYKDEKIGVLYTGEGVTVPDQFKREDYEYEGKAVSLYSNGKIYLILGLDSNKKRHFYIFDKENGELQSKFSPIKIGDRVIYLTDRNIDLKGYSLKTFEIEGESYDCYSLEGEDNYCIFKTVDSDGQEKIYQYEKSEGTLQLFRNAENKNRVCVKENKTGIYILSGILVFCFIIIGIMSKKLFSRVSHEKTI